MNRRLLILVSLAAWMTIPIASTYGETHNLGRLPGKPGKAAFSLSIAIDAVACDGYQPIYLDFKPRGGRTFNRDHQVGVRIAPRNNFISSLDMAFNCQFRLPQGATQLQEIIYVPYYYPWDNVIVTLLEDGRQIESGRGHFNVSILRTRETNQNTTVGVMTAGDAKTQDAVWKKCPDVRTLMTVLGDGPLPEDFSVKRLSHKESLDYVGQVQPAWVQFRPLDENELHDSWLGYSQLDVILVAAPLLARIKTSQPDKMLAIKDWIAAGGNLWIHGAGQTREALSSEFLCEPIAASKIIASGRVASVIDLTDKNDTSDLTYEYYQGVRKRSQDYASRQMLDKMSKRGDVFDKLKTAKHAFAVGKAPKAIAAKIATAKYGLGTVTIIDDEDPYPGSFQLWHSIANLHSRSQIKWLERNGVKPAQGNTNYWAWLIASVGKPPVKSFILLNTLFVIVIGPLAYFLFRRRHRLYLLFFFAPAFALLVTLSLFGYALLADGVTTRLRTRQLTWVDCQHGIATTHSRQTYFAVLGSGDGISFGHDVAVFPVLHSAAIRRYRYHHSDPVPPARLTLLPETQNMSGSFLPARNQVQYATIHPNSVEGLLTTNMQSDPPTVTNDFAFQIRELLISDSAGKFWSSGPIAAGATTVLTQASSAFVEDIIDERVIPNPIDIPMLSANRNTSVIGEQSLLEKKLVRWSKRFPPNCFVGIADLIDGELGVDDALVKDSVHVIMGELP